MSPTTFHLPSGSPLAKAWRASQADAAAGATASTVPPPALESGRLPLAATVPPPLQPFEREEAEAHAQGARARARAMDALEGAPSPAPGEGAIRSNKSYAQRLLASWSDKDARARAAGVDLRKAAFINKLIGTGAAFLMVGLAAAATGLSLGAASPFLAVAATRAALLVGDSVCAWMDWQRSKESLPRSLPMGANCLGNAMYTLAMAGKDDQDKDAVAKAKVAAKFGSGIVTVGLAFTSLGLGVPADGLHLLSALLRYLSAGSVVAATGSQARAADRYDDQARARDRAKSDLFVLMMEFAHGASDIEAYQAWCRDLRVELERQDPGGQARKAFDQMCVAAWQTIHHGDAPPSPVDGDRSTAPQRLVNDLIGLQGGASFTLTAAAHGGAMGAIHAILGAPG